MRPPARGKKGIHDSEEIVFEGRFRINVDQTMAKGSSCLQKIPTDANPINTNGTMSEGGAGRKSKTRIDDGRNLIP